jgi:hypothetical protein
VLYVATQYIGLYLLLEGAIPTAKIVPKEVWGKQPIDPTGDNPL